MENLCLFFVLAILSSSVLGLSFRNKREADDEDDFDDEDNLGDRNELNRPSRPNQPGAGPFPQIASQFPEQLPSQIHDQLPGQQTNPTAQTTVSTPNVNGATTQSSTIQVCIRTCPVTSEYNPVCGSNGVTYGNPGRFLCAKACGVTVNLLRSSRCPATTAAPTS